MSFEPREYLRHILAESDYLMGRCRGLSPEAFEADETLRRAFVRSLEVIGEAAKKLPEEFRTRYPQVEWRAMTGKSPSARGASSPRKGPCPPTAAHVAYELLSA